MARTALASSSHAASGEGLTGFTQRLSSMVTLSEEPAETLEGGFRHV